MPSTRRARDLGSSVHSCRAKVWAKQRMSLRVKTTPRSWHAAANSTSQAAWLRSSAWSFLPYSGVLRLKCWLFVHPSAAFGGVKWQGHPSTPIAFVVVAAVECGLLGLALGLARRRSRALWWSLPASGALVAGGLHLALWGAIIAVEVARGSIPLSLIMQIVPPGAPTVTVFAAQLALFGGAIGLALAERTHRALRACGAVNGYKRRGEETGSLGSRSRYSAVSHRRRSWFPRAETGCKPIGVCTDPIAKPKPLHPFLARRSRRRYAGVFVEWIGTCLPDASRMMGIRSRGPQRSVSTAI